MRCFRARKSISVRMDRALDAAAAETLRGHLSGCSNCRAFASQIEGLAGKLGGFDAPEPRWGFTDRFRARFDNVADSSDSPRGWPTFPRLVPMGLGLAGFSFGVTLTLLANGSLPAEAAEVNELNALADEYYAVAYEDAVVERLLALLPETED